MNRSTRMLIVLALMLTSLYLAAVPAMSLTWDIAADYSTAQNPSGGWSYGMRDPFFLFPSNTNFTGPSFVHWWNYSGSNHWGFVGKNVMGAPYDDGKSYIEAGAMVLRSGAASGGDNAAVRWDAPVQNTVSVTGKFYGQTYNGYSPSGVVVGVYKNGAAVWTGHVSGFVGRIVNGRTDSSGTSPSQPFSLSVPVNAGDKLDFRADGSLLNTDIGLEATITVAGGSGTITGVVRSDAPGNPVVAGATVSNLSGTYSATSASNGSYSLVIPAGAYSLVASKAQFDSTQIDNVQSLSSGTTTLNITLPAWGTFTGTVSSGGTPVQGALVAVSGRTETGTSNSSGVYSITVPAGTYSLAASKPGYDSVNTGSLVLAALGATFNQNISLPLGALVSGVVTDSSLGHNAIAGVNISSYDGVYTTTSDSTGVYSLRVTHGSYLIIAKKSGYLKSTASVNASSTDVTQGFVLDGGYDLAADFALSGNPNGPWSYGHSDGAAVPFVAMNDNRNSWSQDPQVQTWFQNVSNRYGLAGYAPTIEFNPTFSPILTRARWNEPTEYNVIEPMKCIVCPGMGVITFPSYSYNDTRKAVIRFTSPTSGSFNLSATFKAVTKTSDRGGIGSDCGVEIIQNGTPIFGDPATDPKRFYSAFAGTSTNNYTDSFGTETVMTYSSVVDLVYGDTIEAVVYNPGDVSSGWAGVDLTIAMPKNSIQGRVTCDNLSGPVVGATVRAIGPGNYSTLTDQNGNFALYVKPGTYRVEATKTNYNLVRVNGVVVPQDVSVTQNLVMHHTGTWDLTADFSALVNPNGQWSFGLVDPTNVMIPHASTDNRLGAGTVSWVTDSANCWFGINTSDTPAIIQQWANRGNTIAPGKASFGGGGSPSAKGAIRWTAPRTGYFNVNCNVTSQTMDSVATYPGRGLSVRLNGADLVVLNPITGFQGTSTNGYTDSYGPGPAVGFNGVIPMSQGNSLDLVVGEDNNYGATFTWGWPPASMDIWAQISEVTNVVTCSTVAQLRSAVASQPVGTQIVLTTPAQLACETSIFRYARAFNGTAEPSFFIQSDDRVSGMKCIATGAFTNYDTTNKVMLAGTITLDALGQKCLAVGAITGHVASTETKPIGKTSKGLAAANSGTLVKVWGKVKQVVLNNGADSANYTYEYIVISDGGNDVKIPMHVQNGWMPKTDVQISQLEHKDGSDNYDHFVAVTGIAYTSNGTDIAVYPRNVYDFVDYTTSGP